MEVNVKKMEVIVNNVECAMMIQTLMMKKRKNENIKIRNFTKKIVTILILKMKSAAQKYAKFLKSRESSTCTNMLQNSH
jgi:hypothetical protein